MVRLIPLWNGFTYFQHQLEGVQWMLQKEMKGTEVPKKDGNGTVTVYGGFQCDDMGLGKTIQVVSVMLNHPKDATLLIAPLAMIETWSSVCQKAGMAVFEVSKKGEWECKNPKVDAEVAVYISNYEKLYHRLSLFKRIWDRVVLDEAHKIRNGDGDVAVYARRLQAPIRWAVTGTPLVNSLKDIVSLLAFIGVPCSRLWRWEPWFLALLPQIVIHRSLQSLRSVIKGAPPVPEITELILDFQSEEEEEFYQGVQGATDSMIAKYSKDLLSSSEAFLLLLRLRQISVHPQVYINSKRRSDPSYDRPDWTASSAKLEAIKMIMECDDNDVHKYILFCQFNDEMAILREFLLEQQLVKDENILMYNGSMNQAERTAVLKKSKETTETTVLLLQLQAGGVGLNLQEYDRVIFVSPWWTAALMDQAIARAVRMGQTKVVQVYHLRLAAEHSKTINIDEMVNAKAEEKRKMLTMLFEICDNKE
jgi:SNF2 family DNA or RNA helicase